MELNPLPDGIIFAIGIFRKYIQDGTPLEDAITILKGRLSMELSLRDFWIEREKSELIQMLVKSNK